jgi:hypothetical protein
MTPVALSFGVLQITKDAEYLSFVLAAEMIPVICFTLIGGGFADRFNRNVLLRVTNTGAGVSQAAVAACVLTRQDPLVLIPLVAVNGTLQAFTGPALRGIVPQLVEPSEIRRANSLFGISRNASRILGPSLAGILVAAVGGGWAIALDAFSFLFAAACMTRVSLTGKAKAPSRNLARELREGWAYFRSKSWIWSVTIAFAVMNAVQMGVWQVLGPVIAQHGIGAGGWGAVSSAKAVGLLVASFATLRLALSRPLVAGMLGMSLSAVPIILLGIGANAWWLSLAAFAGGIGSGYFGVIWDTTLQANVPNDMISRVSSYDDFGSYLVIPVGQLSVVPLATAFGMADVAVSGGLIYLGVTLLPLLLVSVWQITEKPSIQ